MNRIIKKGFIGLLLVCFLISFPASGQTGGDYDLSWSTIDGGGGKSAGGVYAIVSTIGQPDAGEMSGGNYRVYGGFRPRGLLVSCFVDFEDFAEFAKSWLDAPCNVGNNWCGGADLDSSGDVTVTDLNWVVYFWLDYCPLDWPWE